MGWVSRPPLVKGGQDFGVSAQSFDLRQAQGRQAQEPSNAAHPTILDNLFVVSPLSVACSR